MHFIFFFYYFILAKQYSMATETEFIENLKANYVSSNIENMTKTNFANLIKAEIALVTNKSETLFFNFKNKI